MSCGAECAENGGWRRPAVAGGVNLVLVPAALQAATVWGDREDDVAVLKFAGCASVDVCVPVLAGFDDLGSEVCGVKFAGGGGFGVHF